ncbi:MAG: peptidoglycan-binding domain-containing protein [Candidatus Omnitrophica bacterium]|nr:peptidoglycan-binding domain-containing protein [Candidatus Omnitrophota bacterium]
MNAFIVCVVGVCVVFSFLGCAKKEEPMEDYSQEMSMETLSTVGVQEQAPVTATPAPAVTQPAAAAPASQALQPLPPQGPYKPTNQEIQTALKNAGYYTGAVDGKIGPMSKKAIEDFQKANNLTPDGKVGPKTWAELSKYLAASAASSSEKNPGLKPAR